MIRTVRAFFLGCGLREKILLVGLVTLFVLIWVSNFSDRAGQFWTEKGKTTGTLTDQKHWLSNQATIEAAAERSARQFDAVSTLSATNLYATMEQFTKEAGLLKATLGEKKDEPGGQFILHSLQVTFTQADWDAVVKFYRLIAARSPYISIDQFALYSDGIRSHRASLRVSSVEIIH